jgi:hypothetical protein
MSQAKTENIPRIPVGVNQTQSRCSDEIQPHASCFRAEKEDNLHAWSEKNYNMNIRCLHRCFCDDLLKSFTRSCLLAVGVDLYIHFEA